MDLAEVVALIPSLALERVEKRLREIGVRGLTVTKAKGYGEYANFFSLDWKVEQVKVEVFVARDRVDRIAEAITDAAHTGSAGDGIVAILPVERVLSIRTRAEATPNRFR